MNTIRPTVRIIVVAVCCALLAACGEDDGPGARTDPPDTTGPGVTDTSGAKTDTGGDDDGDAGTGSGDEPGDPDGKEPGAGDFADVEVDLVVRTTAPGGKGQVTYDVTCPPKTPDDRRRCRAIDANPDMFAEVPRDVACTEIYGGPQRATAKGTVDGKKVDTEFTRTNGCEIARWEDAQVVIALVDIEF